MTFNNKKNVSSFVVVKVCHELKKGLLTSMETIVIQDGFNI